MSPQRVQKTDPEACAGVKSSVEGHERRRVVPDMQRNQRLVVNN